MSNITRHIGSYTNTGTRVIVAFRELPDEPGACLVIESDSLPEFYRDAVSHVVSHSGQSTKDLYEVLHRETMPNGENMLQALHTHKCMRKVPTDRVNMHPTRDYTVRLDELNEQLRAHDAGETSQVSGDIQKKFNPYQAKAESLNEADSHNIAARLLQDADDLRTEAERKVERALALRPELAESQRPGEQPKSINVDDIDDAEAMVILSELLERFPIVPETVYVEDAGSDTTESSSMFKLELTGISQRKASDAIKTAWREANPEKVKK